MVGQKINDALAVVADDLDSVATTRSVLGDANTKLTAAQSAKDSAQSEYDGGVKHLAIDVQALYAAIAEETGVPPAPVSPSSTSSTAVAAVARR